MRSDARGGRVVPLGPAAGWRALSTLPRTAGRPDAALTRGAEAAQGVPTPGRRGTRRLAAGCVGRARGRDGDARVHPPCPGAGGAVAGVPRRGPGGRAHARASRALASRDLTERPLPDPTTPDPN